jgi:hypothetical protein
LRDPIAAFVDSLVGMANVIGDQMRVIDLQQEAGIDDGAVLFAYHAPG